MLRISNSLLAQIQSHALSEYPHECCGILIGRKDGDSKLVLEFCRAGNLNVERARDRYLMDPKDQILSEKYARTKNLQIVGYYHSHPDHPARPSRTDHEQSWEHVSYLILSVNRDRVEDAASFSRNATESELASEELVIPQ
jgi:proteasome lid subunit RPN8/RPN11